MKKVFKVVLHLNDGSTNEYRVVAKDDVGARSAAIGMESKSFENSGIEYPGLDFAEIELVCKLDAF